MARIINFNPWPMPEIITPDNYFDWMCATPVNRAKAKNDNEWYTQAVEMVATCGIPLSVYGNRELHDLTIGGTSLSDCILDAAEKLQQATQILLRAAEMAMRK